MDETGDLLIIWTSGLTVEDKLPAILQCQELKRRTAVAQSVEDLIERGQKFRDLAGSHIRHCKGSAFFVNRGKAIKVNINSRVAVDAAFFQCSQNTPDRHFATLGSRIRVELQFLTLVQCSWRAVSERRRKCEETVWTHKS